jgi:hypothetical protein
MNETLEEKNTVVRFFAFLLAVVPTSITVSFAAFLGNEYLLALGLIPCIITLALSIVPTPVKARNILAIGIASCCISLGIIAFTIFTHLDEVRYYMPLPFAYFDKN